ncbi:MAG: CinA family nicotinamide mononucleotide deamidase-related protein [Candidatus Cloacimonadaceae bacterium]|jgi:nicotinamide-nucleotide amidase|nr:CinA family nicotinamide mononucleotide deamidase-related protein [Candidatus Cloacimonadota bacterium]MDY0127228.1 CinA family nicotinamide mononucleotide deamidase-related protein [Candidatus Cloacimonadaceae bacterium]MCB5254615.1 CinA family nicotinamide mononucleotide deamidase-related protein [Candidatus Cloacimonadota bacterium]MCK9178661.1 CinA family nicotinamide mononucleotide deamidase-related protein [Candidatus Cloacimonadota bacterium]MCK9242160.1 CinA family nicotinamide monon
MIIRCAIISIGNEILLGKTVNTNLAWMGSQLALMGFEVCEAIAIKDIAEAITEALDHFWTRYDVVFSTGGLGPTEDDISKAAIAAYFGKELHFDEAIWAKIQQMYIPRGISIPQINRCQAMVPEGFAALDNQRGTAPTLYYKEGNKHFFALQGVPLEMKHNFETHVRRILAQAYPQAEAIIQRTLHSFGVSESAMAEMLSEQELPDGVNLAWLPQTGRLDLKIAGTDAKARDKAEQLIMAKIGDKIWGRDGDTPASVLLDILREKQLNLAVAESCTAGLMQAYIAAIPGASEALLGGVVSYANRIKQELLFVDTIPAHGAVSPETALAMARGVQKVFKSDVAISVTGIAGPDGGSKDKPVGEVHFAFAVFDKYKHVKMQLRGDRDGIRHRAAEAGILLMINLLQECDF